MANHTVRVSSVQEGDDVVIESEGTDDDVLDENELEAMDCSTTDTDTDGSRKAYSMQATPAMADNIPGPTPRNTPQSMTAGKTVRYRPSVPRAPVRDQRRSAAATPTLRARM